jgi:hypothetical protein
MIKFTELQNNPCVFCKRNVSIRGHHIVPKCKGGTTIVSSCESCENFIHATWSHNELRDIYNTVDKIVTDDKFKKFLNWLYKQKSTTTFKTDKSNNRIKHKYR